jgi:D-cysteine desulfhydrase family pyridoxal phosphate-dependent enzyme
MRLDQMPRVRLAKLPTPLEKMSNLSKVLGGPQLFIKRDDLTGLALGGNKLRMLEFFLGDAIDKGADTIITSGYPQSNHCRLTAAATRMAGLHPIIVHTGERPEKLSGNMIINYLFDAETYFVSVDENLPLQQRHEECVNRGEMLVNEIREKLERSGKKPYVIPRAGRSLFGTAGYVTAMVEMYHQMLDMGIKADYIILPTASTGTMSGVILGSQAASLNANVLGISVLRNAADSMELLNEELEKDALSLGFDFAIDRSKYRIDDNYIGPGYGIATEETLEAMKLLAKTEGILLDPTYTGKAMAGLIDMIGKGLFDEGDTIVFIHTGGLPILFTHEINILSK